MEILLNIVTFKTLTCNNGKISEDTVVFKEPFQSWIPWKL